MEASLRNLENQVGQLANNLSRRPQGGLPSNTEKNPREEVNVVTLRNVKELVKVENEPRKVIDKGKKAVKKTPKKDDTKSSKPTPEVKAYKPKVPFPAKLKQHALDKQFAKFLEAFKKLHINIHFADALAQMSSYAKFLKEIFGNKRKLEDYETVKLNEECSAIILNKLPPKVKDLGSFTIPCTIGNCHFDKVLCDLGVSINLMPLPIMQKLGLE